MLAWSDALRVVHDKWKVNVFSDAYPEVPTADNLDNPFPQTFQAHKPLTESLNVGTLWGRMWWRLQANQELTFCICGEIGTIGAMTEVGTLSMNASSR